MSTYRVDNRDDWEARLFHRRDVVALRTHLSRGIRANYTYRRELLIQQTILQNNLDKLFSMVLSDELLDDAEVVELCYDLNQHLRGPWPWGLKGNAVRRLEEYLGDSFEGFALLVEMLKGFISIISTSIKTGLEEQSEAFVKHAKGERSSADRETLRLERRQLGKIPLDTKYLDQILSNIPKARILVLKIADLYQESFSWGRSDNDTASITSVRTEVGYALKMMFSGAKNF